MRAVRYDRDMHLLRSSTALALLGSCAALAACGGDDGGKALSAADYRTQFGKICTEAQTRTKALDAPTGTDGKDFKEALDKTVPILDQTLDKIDDLNPPKDLQSAHDEYVSATREGVKIIEDVEDKIDEDKPITEQAAVITPLTPKLDAIGKRTQAAATKLGVQSCNS